MIFFIIKIIIIIFYMIKKLIYYDYDKIYRILNEHFELNNQQINNLLIDTMWTTLNLKIETTVFYNKLY